MSTLHLELPGDVTPDEARLSLAVKLFEQGRVALAAAAEMAGRTTAEFRAIVGASGHGIDDADALVAGSVAATLGSLPVEDFSDWERR